MSRVTGRSRAGASFRAVVGGSPTDLSAAPGAGTTVGVGVVSRVGAGRFRAAEAAPALGASLGQSEAANGSGAPRGVGVALDGAGRVQVSSTGGSRGPEVRLGTLGRGLYARVVKARTGAISAREALTLRPSWGDLRGGRIRATRRAPGGAERASAVGGHVVRQRAIRSIAASASGGQVRWRVGLRRPAEVTVAIDIERAGCCSARRIFRGAAGSYALPDLPPGRSRVNLSVTAQDRENPFLLQKATRRLRPSP